MAFRPDVIEHLRPEGRPVADACAEVGVLKLITELVARLGTAAPDAIDDAIVDSLRQIAGMWQLDRAVLWRKSADDGSVVASYCWTEDRRLACAEPGLLASIPLVASTLEAGEAIWFTHIEEMPDPCDRETFLRCGFRSAAVVPVAAADGACGVQGGLAFGSTREHDWSPVSIQQLRLLSGILSQALARRENLGALQRTLAELRDVRITEPDVKGRDDATIVRALRLRDHLHAENHDLRRQAQQPFGTSIILGQSRAIGRVLEQARQVAATDSTVLLLGETGTGKEVIATQIHDLSTRRGRAMVRVNCSAIPSTLIESELFGREKGAFTGALARQIGRFESADRSTIFLDEIGDLPAEIQVKLLRVLEERQFERLGSPKPVRVDVRIIAATHRNLEKRIAEDAFREDLFYRLNVFPIQVPALRDRAEDIPLLVWRFVDEFSKALGKRIDAVSRENMAALQQYAWPGNIRELRNVVERAMIVATGTELAIPVPTPSRPVERCSVRLADVQKEHVRSVLESTGWRIRGANGAAERLGLRPTTLETRMAKLGLHRPRQASTPW
jgi:transcriptional regulator with GAF, ATPase, and Fis domain